MTRIEDIFPGAAQKVTVYRSTDREIQAYLDYLDKAKIKKLLRRRKGIRPGPDSIDILWYLLRKQGYNIHDVCSYISDKLYGSFEPDALRAMFRKESYFPPEIEVRLWYFIQYQPRKPNEQLAAKYFLIRSLERFNRSFFGSPFGNLAQLRLIPDRSPSKRKGK